MAVRTLLRDYGAIVYPDPGIVFEQERQRYAKCAARFSVSHMSNTKWRRVFCAIADAGVESLRSEWKHIDSEHITQHLQLPRRSDLLDNRFQDGYFQPYEYKWIQWIRVPREYFDEDMRLTRDQDLTAIKAALKVSRAVVVSDDESITIVGYEKPTSA